MNCLIPMQTDKSHCILLYNTGARFCPVLIRERARPISSIEHLPPLRRGMVGMGMGYSEGVSPSTLTDSAGAILLASFSY